MVEGSTSGPTFRPLAPLFGAEAIGIDLARDLSRALATKLLHAWYEYSLLLFRDQRLSEEHVEKVAGIFGEVTHRGQEGDRAYVSNVLAEGLTAGGELAFHTDMSFWEDPIRGVILYAIEVPPEGAGGDTLFSSVKHAYELLPPRLREAIGHLEIVHTTARTSKVINPPESAVHEIAYTHPITGEKLLFCSPRHFERIVGLSQEDGQVLCDELEGYIARPEITYTHVWRPGDLVVWDNLKLQHARTNFDPAHRRHLRRVQFGSAQSAVVP